MKKTRKKGTAPAPAPESGWQEPETVMEKQSEAVKTQLLKEALNPFWASRMTNR
jgi:hypothetical protein